MYGIKFRHNDSYLAATTESRGSAAGVGRVWTEDKAQALTFATRQEAEEVLFTEFEGYERRDTVDLVEL